MESAMSAVTECKEYRSPKHKLVDFFRRSRDGWKRKCQAAKRKAKSSANHVAVLKKSRNRWKSLVRQQREEIARLRQELEAAKKSPR